MEGKPMAAEKARLNESHDLAVVVSGGQSGQVLIYVSAGRCRDAAAAKAVSEGEEGVANEQ